MVAQLNLRAHARTLRTPGPSPRDSDDVLLALETAQALEMRGDMAEAARWIRRAANESEKQGNDARVLVLAHAAADLTNAAAAAPATKATPRVVRQREPHDSEPTLHWRATPPPLPGRASSLPARVSSVPAPSSPISSIVERSNATDLPVKERKPRMGAIRVAITKPISGGSFSVERLDAHQPLPQGTIEGLLVVAGNLDESDD